MEIAGGDALGLDLLAFADFLLIKKFLVKNKRRYQKTLLDEAFCSDFLSVLLTAY
jgi:hypothetical protein